MRRLQPGFLKFIYTYSACKPCEHRKSTVRAPCEHRASTVRAPCEHRASTERAPCEHRASTVRAPKKHRVSTVRAPCEHRASTERAPCEHRASTEEAPCEHRGSTEGEPKGDRFFNETNSMDPLQKTFHQGAIAFMDNQMFAISSWPTQSLDLELYIRLLRIKSINFSSLD